LTHIVRLATSQDLPHILDMERQCSTAAHWTEQRYRSLFEQASGPVGWLVLVAEGLTITDSGNKSTGVLGFLIARHSPFEWDLENLVVAPRARRKGIATLLLSVLLEHAQGQPVFLEVRESNTVARTLYEKAGFQQSGRRKSYYSNPVEDAILYSRRTLPAPISE
jgi:ribosomal-protein-alanine N-acetyltransferase